MVNLYPNINPNKHDIIKSKLEYAGNIVTKNIIK